MKRIAISILALLLALLLLMPLLLSAFSATQVFADSGAYQDEIDSIEQQKEALQNERAEMQANIDELMAERDTVLEKKAVLDEKNQLAQEEIDLINEQIDVYNDLIDQKAVELEEAQAAEDAQYELYCRRVRAMEENGSYTYLDILFQCRSLGELL